MTHLLLFVLFPARSINAPETTLVCVRAVKLKQKKIKNGQSRFVHASFVPFILTRLSRTNG